MKKGKKRFSIFGVFVSLVFLAFFITSLVYFLQAIKQPVTIKDNEAADMESGVTLYTSPTTINAIKGESFSVDLDIDTQDESVSGADLLVNYDKNYLVVNSITKRDFLPKLMKKSDDLEGNISIVVAGDKDGAKNGSGTLATITFTALTTGSTTISYNNLSQVAASNKLVNVLTASSGTSININNPPSVISSKDRQEGSNIYIFASGTMGGGQYPTMELLVKNETASIFYNVDETQKKYFYHHPTKVDPEDIKLRFVNDFNDGQGDRNLRVNKIQVDGRDFETEDTKTYSVGSWNQNSCGEGYKKSEWLYCNGEFSYMRE